MGLKTRIEKGGDSKTQIQWWIPLQFTAFKIATNCLLLLMETNNICRVKVYSKQGKII